MNPLPVSRGDDDDSAVERLRHAITSQFAPENDLGDDGLGVAATARVFDHGGFAELLDVDLDLLAVGGLVLRCRWGDQQTDDGQQKQFQVKPRRLSSLRSSSSLKFSI